VQFSCSLTSYGIHSEQLGLIKALLTIVGTMSEKLLVLETIVIINLWGHA
jgi:hypothetical protein